MSDQWVTFAPNLSGTWLMQGWQIVAGTVTKIAETPVTYPYPASGPIDNDYYELVEHPLGGVAIIGVENDGSLTMTRYTIKGDGFVRGPQVVADMGTYAAFYVTANYVVLSPPYPGTGVRSVLSLIDLSEVTTFNPEALGLVKVGTFLGTKAVVGDTLWFLDGGGGVLPGYEWPKGVKLDGGTASLITLDGAPTYAGDAYMRFSNGLESQRRDRWHVFPGSMSRSWTTDSGIHLGDFWQSDHQLIDADGRITTVQFPAVDARFSEVVGGVRIRTGAAATQWFFGEPAANGDIVASWVGYAHAEPAPGPGTAPAGPHRFHGSVTIPNGGGTVTTTCVADGLCGSTIFGDDVADSGWRGSATTGFSAVVGFRVDPAFSPNEQPYTWYSINPNRVVTDLQTVDPDSESVPGLSFSYTSDAPYGVPLPVITGELVASGRDFT